MCMALPLELQLLGPPPSNTGAPQSFFFSAAPPMPLQGARVGGSKSNAADLLLKVILYHFITYDELEAM